MNQKYNKFVEDDLRLSLPVTLRDVYHFRSEHDIIGYLIAREIDYGNEQLSEFMELDNVRGFKTEGDKWETGNVEDWVILGEESISVGQSVSCRYKPEVGGIPYDVRQAYWFHEVCKNHSESDINPPYIIAVDQKPEEVKNEDELLNSFRKEDELEVIIRRLDPDMKEEVLNTCLENPRMVSAD